MNGKNKPGIFNTNGKLSRIMDWMRSHHFPPKIIFIIMGIISTVWFLIRVIPKPSRAAYPCMRVAAPFMSGFIVYLISLCGITLALRKVRQNLYRAKYVPAGLLIVVVLAIMVISLTHGSTAIYAGTQIMTGPDDGPNKPIGKAKGINPGRVIWSWDKEATNENCTNTFDKQDWFWKPENTNRDVVSNMVSNSLIKLTGKPSIAESWDALFRYQNIRKHNKNVGYTKGEKIFIKINQNSSRGVLGRETATTGFDVPTTLKPGEERKKFGMGSTDTGPYIVLEILRELVNNAGVNQEDIAVGDPMCPLYGYDYDVWFKEFPHIAYIDRTTNTHGRTLITPSSADLVFYSDKTISDKLYDVIEKADYLINVANLKPHTWAGISMNAKNLFGAQARTNASHLHYALPVTYRDGIFDNGGYRKYRNLVDLMGSKYLGSNTVLFVVDGLFAGGSSQNRGPVKYFMPPFNNDWSSSIFLSQDEVALESVCFDFLRTEWNGINKHDPSNNVFESIPNGSGVDDYLHQAADSTNWPEGIKYDPDNSGKPIPSLGVHEHWNNPEKKQYTRNLGSGKGIELISIPENLVQTVTSASTSASTLNNSNNVNTRSFGEGFTAKTFYSSQVDGDNIKWFLTDKGIVSFDGKKWSVHNKNRKVPSADLKDFKYDFSSYGPEVWIASPTGAVVASLPVDARSGATTYHTENSTILSDTVLSVAVGEKEMRWFGTSKGISGFRNKKWLTYAYQRKYPEGLFRDFPITCMATSIDGDTLYAGTFGAGVARVFRNKVDAISGASEYAQWGPILMPSDTVHSIFIARDGTQWFGTSQGVARHTGYNTLEKWTVFDTSNGLVHNLVQAVAGDSNGKVWCGTKGGVSVFDGSSWKSYSESDGLVSNNVLCISVDKSGNVWMGTDKGVTCLSNGKFINYQ